MCLSTETESGSGRWAERAPTFAYLRSVVETGERLGFYSLLIPTRFSNELFKETDAEEIWSRVRMPALLISSLESAGDPNKDDRTNSFPQAQKIWHPQRRPLGLPRSTANLPTDR